MTTWYGKQPNTDDPNLAHEGGLEAWTGASTFKGTQAGQADPTIAGKLRRRPQDES